MGFVVGAVILLMGLSFLARPGQYRSAGVVIVVAAVLILAVQAVTLAPRH